MALRPQLVGIGPLLPSVQEDLGVTHAVAGLLGTIPVLCMGVFAPPASFLSGRVGSRRAIAAALRPLRTVGGARADRAARSRRRSASSARSASHARSPRASSV